jgi:hypothetical protein
VGRGELARLDRRRTATTAAPATTTSQTADARLTTSGRASLGKTNGADCESRRDPGGDEAPASAGAEEPHRFGGQGRRQAKGTRSRDETSVEARERRTNHGARERRTILGWACGPARQATDHDPPSGGAGRPGEPDCTDSFGSWRQATSDLVGTRAMEERTSVGSDHCSARQDEPLHGDCGLFGARRHGPRALRGTRAGTQRPLSRTDFQLEGTAPAPRK